MSTYKLFYFNSRGRAEISRLIFATAGQKYEDIRYEHDQWLSHKAEAPLGQVPVLEVDGMKLPQSLTIARFLAKQFHLAGKDNLEQAKVDAVVDTINDALSTFITAFVAQYETKNEELMKKFFDEDLPKYFHNLEILAKLYSDDGPFFVRNKLSWADLFFYATVEKFLAVQANCLDKHSWLKQNRAEVEKQPRIAEHLQNRPTTQY